MARKMEPLEVYISDTNDICIRQAYMGDEDVVVLDANQVPILIKWLEETLQELKEQKSKTGE